jgi:ribosomal protein S18 acetylase RimI-like enzyme
MLALDPDTRLAIVNQVQANMIAYFRQFVGLAGITMIDQDVVWLLNAHGEPGNHVLQTRLNGPAIDQRLDQILAEIARVTDHVDWLVFPGCQPSDLGARLAARGLPSGLGGTWMLADLAAPPPTLAVPTGLEFALVRTPEQLAMWREASRAGFGGDAQIYYDAYLRQGFGPDTPMHCLYGHIDGRPVVSGMLLLAGGIAGMWDISTPPELRRQGYGSALTLAMLDLARQHGYLRAWLWASQMGRRMYQRAGFVQYDLGVREYRWQR